MSIRISEDGSYQFVREIRGDSVADILDYVEYDPRRILEDLREAAERAVREKRITPSERYKILQTFEDGLRGYTYFERRMPPAARGYRPLDPLSGGNDSPGPPRSWMGGGNAAVCRAGVFGAYD